jgi:hypothetical protein
MWFVAIMMGMILACACFYKWTDAKIQIEQILKEELNDDDNEDGSESRGEVRH